MIRELITSIHGEWDRVHLQQGLGRMVPAWDILEKYWGTHGR